MKPLKYSALIILCLFCATSMFAASEQPVSSNETNSQEVLRSYLQLQEQIHGTQLAIERNRKEAEATAAERDRVFTEKLAAIESSLSVQRSRELEAMQSSNKVMLIVASAFAGIGLCAMLLMAYFQSKAVNRLAEISASLPALRATPQPLLSFGSGEVEPGLLGPVGQSNLRLMGALERLEKRMYELESGAALSGTAAAGATNGNGKHPEQGSAGLLVRGQELLENGQPEEALSCFEQAIQKDPSCTDALVKKGSALEKMQRFDEAIECYDRAIAANSSLTIAYLYKAGLCNRMERFSDALACYEKALQAQEKRAA